MFAGAGESLLDLTPMKPVNTPRRSARLSAKKGRPQQQQELSSARKSTAKKRSSSMFYFTPEGSPEKTTKSAAGTSKIQQEILEKELQLLNTSNHVFQPIYPPLPVILQPKSLPAPKLEQQHQQPQTHQQDLAALAQVSPVRQIASPDELTAFILDVTPMKNQSSKTFIAATSASSASDTSLLSPITSEKPKTPLSIVNSK